jgi:urease accessory protein
MHDGIDTKGATQIFEITVAENAFFCYIPHPTVPHKHATFSDLNSIKLHPTSKLIWGEIISCGRKLNGEIFQFTRLRIKTEIFVNGKLVIKENLLAEPAKTTLSSIGQWEGYSHQASLFIVDDCLDMCILKELLLTFLQQQKFIEFGISELHIKGLVIRLFGYKGEQLYACLQQIADLVMLKMEQKMEPYVA